MATKTTAFPRLPERQWWALRDRFKQSIPSRVTPSYLATVLNMKENSAKANILPALEAAGLVSSDGGPTELAKRWRDDAEYPAVVKEIREALYPDELLDAIPEPAADRPATERWFANRTGHGEAAAKKMAQFYELLADGNPLRGQAKVARAEQSSARSAPRPRRARSAAAQPAKPTDALPLSGGQDPLRTRVRESSPNAIGGPTLHIDVQIHISADASGEQIDQIFASMAKHLYNRPE